MDIARIARGARFGLLAALLLLVVGSGDRVPRRESPPIPLPALADTAGQHPLHAGLAPVLATALAADQANAYAVLPFGDQRDAFRAANSAQHLTTAFLPDGLAITDDSASGAPAKWEMHLAAIGDGANLLPVAAALPTLNGTRVEYRRGNVTEWYLNSPLGVEQGFTLATPPVGVRTGDLVLAVNVTGAVTADDGAGGITLALPDGGQARYGQLTATDATGRALPARLVADGGAIQIVVNDRGAVYPVVVDPLVQQGSKLLGSGETGQGYFGYAVALSGDGNTALIGALNDNSALGAAFVFTGSGGVWTPQGSKLTGSGEIGQGEFGYAVALSGDGNTALIGALNDNSSVGAAFAFAFIITDVVPTGGTPQSAPVGAAFATPFSVHAVYSATGAAAPNTTVTFTAPTVGASGAFPGGATSATVTTDASGNATAPLFTANATAGNYAVLASASGGQAVFALGNAAGSAATIIASTGSSQSATIGAPFATTLRATVLDMYDNPVPGVAVTFAAPGTGASGTFGGSTTVTTNSNGVAIAPLFTANAIAGSFTVSATATGVSVPTTFALTNTPGPAASLAFTGFPASVVAGVAQSFTLTARDSGGNIATGYTGTVSFASVNTAATLPATYTFTPADRGMHTFAATLLTVGTGRGITATDTVTGSITGSQSGIAVLPAVTTFAPFNGPQAGGTPVTITGIGLTGATSVTIGGSACTGMNSTGTSLTCTTTGHAVAGTVDVVVTTPNGVGTLVHGFTYLPVSMSPAPVGRSGGAGGSGGSPAPAPQARTGSSGSGNASVPAAVPGGQPGGGNPAPAPVPPGR